MKVGDMVKWTPESLAPIILKALAWCLKSRAHSDLMAKAAGCRFGFLMKQNPAGGRIRIWRWLVRAGDLIKFGPKEDLLGVGIVLDIKDDDNIKVHMQWIESGVKWRDTTHVWSRRYIEQASEVVST